MPKIKEGDLVRVQGASFLPGKDGRVRHHIKAGAVCVVLSTYGDSVNLAGPIRKDCRPGNEDLNGHVGEFIQQAVRPWQVKLAKQAMRKRDEYANRRG